MGSIKITITNKSGKPAKDYLNNNKTRFPEYSITSTIVYNGIVIEIDDDDAEDFEDALDAAGFVHEMDSENSSYEATFPKDKPVFPKHKPILPKSKPKLQKVKPKLPRY